MIRALLLASWLVTSAALAAGPALTLEDALTQTRQNLPALRQVRANAQAGTARAREALAPMLPQVGLNVGYSRSTGNYAPKPGSNALGTSSATYTLNSYDYWSGSLSVSQTVWDFGQQWNRYQSSLSTADALAATVHTQEVGAVLATRNAYWNAAAQRELVAVAQVSLEKSQAHYDQIAGFVKVGTRPEIDLAQSRSDRAQAKLALVQAVNAYASAKLRLAQAMGVDGNPEFEVSDPAPGPLENEGQAVEALLPEALSSRPEVAGFEAQVRAQQLILKSTRGAFWPTLSAQLGGTLGGQQLTAVAPNLSGGLSLSWQLYQGGLTTAQVTEGDATLVSLEAQRDTLKLQVRVDVEQALLGVKAARESVDASHEAADAAKDQLRLAEARYQAGAGSVIELTDAQTTARAAAAQEVQAVYGLAQARAALLAALGRS
jgi:outer membrane protein